jgi:hypothetical protein
VPVKAVKPAIPVKAVNPATPAIPNISRRVYNELDGIVSIIGNESADPAEFSDCFLSIMVRISIGRNEFAACRGVQIKGIIHNSSEKKPKNNYRSPQSLLKKKPIHAASFVS